jgi:hypothetical protein
MQHEALVQFQLPVQHVNAKEEIRFGFGGEMRRGGFETLDRHTMVLACIAFAPDMGLLLGKPTLHQVFGMIAQRRRIFRRKQPADDQEAVAAKAGVLIDGDLVAIGKDLLLFSNGNRDDSDMMGNFLL